MMRTKDLIIVQSLILAGGTVFAWSKLIPQFSNFSSFYGTIFRFKDCAIPNPLTTACFYGSLAFIVALIWSITLIRLPQLTGERRLRNFLLFCVCFAGSVFLYEVADYYKLFPTGDIPISCTPGVPPVQTPCFFGMLFFIGSYITAWVAVRNLKLAGAVQQ